MQPRGLAHDDRHSISGGPNMHWTRGILTFAAICGLLIGSNAAAHEEDPAGDIAALKEAQQKIETELSEVKGELQALRGELKKVLTELKALKAKQNTPKKQSKRPAEQLLGQPAPQRKVTTTESKEITIGGKQDKPQVLFFYASWCPHCRRAMPGMPDMLRQPDKPGRGRSRLRRPMPPLPPRLMQRQDTQPERGGRRLRRRMPPMPDMP